MSERPGRLFRWLLPMVVTLAGCEAPHTGDLLGEQHSRKTPLQTGSAASGPQGSSESEPAAGRPATFAGSGAATRDCTLAVAGQVHVRGRCLVFDMGEGGYTLNAWSEGKPRHSHFAVVVVTASGTANASWNADPDDDRATDPLGVVEMVDGCWVNDRARICAK